MTHDAEKQSLAATARWTAAARAAESARSDCLFSDPWAADLAGEEGAAWFESVGGSVAPMVIRTRFFDEFLQQAVQHGLRQVVILASGLDTRAYRLNWPAGTRLFELDQAPVLAHKAEIMAAAQAQPRCQRVTIPADLSGPWSAALAAAGFDSFQPTAWLLEGLLFYLPGDAILTILKDVSILAAPGSRLGFDIINSLTLNSPITHAWIEMQARAGAPWLGALDDPETLLAELGWQAALTQPGAPDAHYQRWKLPVIPVKMPNMPHQWYVTAEKIA
jgi:methyltransferase (TIGR00027 family)